ncbi:MAG: hypothetical protein WCA11_04400 [Terracidiphilus sp.]
MRQEVYRVAYDEAKSELGEILGKFEALRLRKDRIEKVVEALKPLLGADAQTAFAEKQAPAPERQPAFAVPEPIHQVADPVPQAVPQAVDQGSDPFQRRVDAAVGLGSVARDVKEYSRLFNGGSSH